MKFPGQLLFICVFAKASIRNMKEKVENEIVFAQFFVALLVQLVLASESLVDPKAFVCIALCGPAVASSSIATDHYS